ncbi:N-alpha-acetyltransferase 25, NatB auxiliary subunit [Anthophora plagiata]
MIFNLLIADKISEVYEAAAKVDPNNEELLTDLFMSYVRLGDYKKQQQTALALYKLKPKNPYYFWAVMSVVMQAIHADEELAKGVTLPLAERMVCKLEQNYYSIMKKKLYYLKLI